MCHVQSPNPTAGRSRFRSLGLHLPHQAGWADTGQPRDLDFPISSKICPCARTKFAEAAVLRCVASRHRNPFVFPDFGVSGLLLIGISRIQGFACLDPGQRGRSPRRLGSSVHRCIGLARALPISCFPDFPVCLFRSFGIPGAQGNVRSVVACRANRRGGRTPMQGLAYLGCPEDQISGFRATLHANTRVTPIDWRQLPLRGLLETPLSRYLGCTVSGNRSFGFCRFWRLSVWPSSPSRR
jgi:hypothetical protein